MMKKHKPSSQTQKMSDQDILDLLEETGKQYRIYKEINDIVHLVQSMPTSKPADLPPSPEYPHLRTFSNLTS